jgi:hypothetical protein
MDDIYAIRRNNLRIVWQMHAGSNQSQLARDLDIADQPGLISRWLKDKPIGDDVARKVERTYGLDFGWMDNVHPSNRAQLVANAYQDADAGIKRATERVLNLATEPEGNAPSPKDRGRTLPAERPTPKRVGKKLPSPKLARLGS